MTHVDDRMNAALDDALEMTFPASDPIAIYMPDERSADTGNSASNR
jgi:hypothetical protein